VPAAMKRQLQPYLERLMAQGELTEPERRLILELRVIPVEIKAGENFPARAGAYLIGEGIAAELNYCRSGTSQITAFYLSGDFPGLHAIFRENPSQHLQAVTPTRALFIPKSELDKVALNPNISRAFWINCKRELAISRAWTARICRHNGFQRIAHLICEMAFRQKVNVAGKRFAFPFPFKQRHLAEAIGVSIVHANRVLVKMKEQDAFYYNGKMGVVPDWPYLENICDFDPSYLQM
jgi:CRP-like cAMP-binding protein